MLDEKVMIVTGGSRGIGKAIVLKLAEQGAVVYAVSTHQGADREWIDSENTRVKGEIRSLYFDISDSKACREAVISVRKECGHIDGLVNNAGIEFNELIGMLNGEHMKRMFEVNVYGSIFMLEHVSRVMRRQASGGSIVNIASQTAIYGNAGQSVYSATKGALISFSKSAAKELAPNHIRVNVIAPGLTNTEMMQQVDVKVLQKRIDNIGLGRIAEPEDIADACVFMLSDSAGYISGQVLSVDGCSIL